MLPVNDDVVHDRQARSPADPLHGVLVHRQRRSQHTRADVRELGQFEQTLHGAILAEGAVQHGEDHVDARVGARLGEDGARVPPAVLTDEESQDLVLLRVHRGDDRFGGTKGDFVLAAAAAVEYRYSQFHRILFPKADITSSTASIAVRLAWSITGLTSTTSIDVM